MEFPLQNFEIKKADQHNQWCQHLSFHFLFF